MNCWVFDAAPENSSSWISTSRALRVSMAVTSASLRPFSRMRWISSRDRNGTMRSAAAPGMSGRSPRASCRLVSLRARATRRSKGVAAKGRRVIACQAAENLRIAALCQNARQDGADRPALAHHQHVGARNLGDDAGEILVAKRPGVQDDRRGHLDFLIAGKLLEKAAGNPVFRADALRESHPRGHLQAVEHLQQDFREHLADALALGRAGPAEHVRKCGYQFTDFVP